MSSFPYLFRGFETFESMLEDKLEKNFLKIFAVYLGSKTLLSFSFKQIFGVEIHFFSNPKLLSVFHNSFGFFIFSVS